MITWLSSFLVRDLLKKGYAVHYSGEQVFSGYAQTQPKEVLDEQAAAASSCAWVPGRLRNQVGAVASTQPQQTPLTSVPKLAGPSQTLI